MQIIELLKKIFFRGEKAGGKSDRNTIYNEKDLAEQIHSIWDYIKLNENTQASHIIAVLGFDEWIPMEEIMRRIRELFRVDYQNDRSLYPYIKTLVDVGLVEAQSTGGKKKWRKRDVLIKVKGKKAEETQEEEEKIATQARN